MVLSAGPLLLRLSSLGDVTVVFATKGPGPLGVTWMVTVVLPPTGMLAGIWQVTVPADTVQPVQLAETDGRESDSSSFQDGIA